MPWGYIAGKWWGPKNVRPILAIHGWQDNAGTFDLLIPHLPNHVGYLAIDLPGHGQSSHFPAGMTYSTLDFLNSIELIRKHFNWDRLSLLAHSMGSQLSFYHASTLPHVCDMLIGIDVLKPLVRLNARVQGDMHKQLEKLIIEDDRQKNPKEPPSYTYDELIERLYKGTVKSVSRETAHHLLKRSIQKSNTHSDKYFFSRDNRLKLMNYAYTYHELNLDMARKITAPHMFIKALQSPYFEEIKYYNETIDVLKQNPLFELVNVEGKHHVHLTEPNKICSQVSAFIHKYRPST